MRKTNEVLRLHFELGPRQREIARACSISQGAVHNYLKKAAAAGITWPLPEGWATRAIPKRAAPVPTTNGNVSFLSRYSRSRGPRSTHESCAGIVPPVRSTVGLIYRFGNR